jgi:hypothetical protein
MVYPEPLNCLSIVSESFEHIIFAMASGNINFPSPQNIKHKGRKANMSSTIGDAVANMQDFPRNYVVEDDEELEDVQHSPQINTRRAYPPIETDLSTPQKADSSQAHDLFNSKVPITTLDEVEAVSKIRDMTPQRVCDDSDDSFVTQIISRSPAKPVLRMEDATKIYDKLEEDADTDLSGGFQSPQDISHYATPPSCINESFGKGFLVSRTIDSATKQSTKNDTAIRKAAVADLSTAVGADNEDPIAPQGQLPSQSTMRGSSYFRATTLSNATVRPQAVVLENERRLNKAKSMPTNNAQSTRKPLRTSSFVRLGGEDHIKQIANATIEPKRLVHRPSVKSLLPPKQPVKSTKPVTRPAFELPGDAVARKLKEQREARESLRDLAAAGPLIPKRQVKCAKPPTRPNFELPGEALSRRKKEAHEAKIKLQEEEERKRREFKAKPLRKSVSALNSGIRETTASRIRQANAGQKTENENARLERPYSNLSIDKRASLVGAHRPSILALNRANVPAVRATGAASAAPRKISGNEKPAMTSLTTQKTLGLQRGRDIYRRTRALSESLETEKKNREAAAMRARAEAAERGRQASREWAEKQRAKRSAEGTKG